MKAIFTKIKNYCTGSQPNKKPEDYYSSDKIRGRLQTKGKGVSSGVLNTVLHGAVHGVDFVKASAKKSRQNADSLEKHQLSVIRSNIRRGIAKAKDFAAGIGARAISATHAGDLITAGYIGTELAAEQDIEKNKSSIVFNVGEKDTVSIGVNGLHKNNREGATAYHLGLFNQGFLNEKNKNKCLSFLGNRTGEAYQKQLDWVAKEESRFREFQKLRKCDKSQKDLAKKCSEQFESATKKKKAEKDLIKVHDDVHSKNLAYQLRVAKEEKKARKDEENKIKADKDFNEARERLLKHGIDVNVDNDGRVYYRFVEPASPGETVTNFYKKNSKKLVFNKSLVPSQIGSISNLLRSISRFGFTDSSKRSEWFQECLDLIKAKKFGQLVGRIETMAINAAKSNNDRLQVKIASLLQQIKSQLTAAH